MCARHVGYDRAARARDAVLRKARLSKVRNSLGLLRHALDRISENSSLKARRRANGRSGTVIAWPQSEATGNSRRIARQALGLPHFCEALFRQLPARQQETEGRQPD